MSAHAIDLHTGERPLSIVEHRDWQALETMRPGWSNLVSQLPEAAVFQTPEWLYPWWRAYGADRKFCVLAFTNESRETVGIAPLYWEQRKPRMLPELLVLRMIGDGSSDSDDLDFIVKPGYAAKVAKAFVGWLRSAPWDMCEFNCLSSRSETVALVIKELHEPGWRFASAQRPSARVTFPETWENYLKDLAAKERRKIGHRLRHLEARHKVCIRRCERDDELPEFLNNLFALHQKRWEERGEPGTFSFPERRRFYAEMTRELLRHGWLELWEMDLDGAPVASQIGMRYGNSIVALQEGFDPARATDSVGYVLRSQILRNCIESGAHSYDFLYGDQESKLRWGAKIGHYIDFRASRRWTYGAIYLGASQGWRDMKLWLQVRAPKAWQILRGLRRTLRKSRKHVEQDEAND